MSPSSKTLEERLWSKVDATGDCWEWTAGRSRGYGRFAVNGSPVAAHRVVYELLVGPIPEGLELDHLCRVRHCVNPDHLEPVTSRTNVLRGATVPAMHSRKTHCVNGHRFSEVNTYIGTKAGRPYRDCRTCKRNRLRALRRRNAARVAASAPESATPKSPMPTGFSADSEQFVALVALFTAGGHSVPDDDDVTIF